MRREQKLLLALVSIFLSQLCGTRGTAVFKYYTSKYGAVCYDACESRGCSYYWCNTREGWDYCSPFKNIDYKGYKCKGNYPCEKHGYSYYWCNRDDDSWGYCGKVEPKTLIQLSSTYQSACIEECTYDLNENYYWCHTEEGWDYCSPYPGVTFKAEPCRSDHPCGTHGYTYTWCWTDSDWGYCGLIEISGLYTIIKRQKRQPNNIVEICTETDNKQTKLYAEPNPTAIEDVGRWRNEIINLISRWNNSYLGNQAPSQLINSTNLHMDLQGLGNSNNQSYYNLQVQLNVPHRPGTSTTVAQVLIPQTEDVPGRCIRKALTESFRRRARVFVDVSHDNFPVKPGQSHG